MLRIPSRESGSSAHAPALARSTLSIVFLLLVLGPAAAARAGQSSPIAISDNNQFLVCVNPDKDTVTVFDPSGGNAPVKLGEAKVGTDPSSVAIHPNNTTAYVANAFNGTVTVINLQTRARITGIRVGAEPMGLALSPNGSRLYVANSSSNNIMVIDTTTNGRLATVDLSGAGTSPRAVAVTDDGDADDNDETVFVAMFFGQLRPGKSFGDEGQDDQREGRLVSISAATNTVLGAPNPITLGPLANTGFMSNGQLSPATPGPPVTPAVASTNPQTFTTPTGAFPNQLADVAIRPGTNFAYVVSTGASPNGPLRFNHMAQGLVSIFNTATRSEVTSAQTGKSIRQTAPLNLNQDVNRATTPAPRLFMTNPVAMAWRPNGADAWVVIQNSNLVTRLTVDANGIPTIGAPLAAGPSSIVRVDLENAGAGFIPGKAPRGVVINTAGTRAYVSNYVSRSVTAINISNPTAPTIVGTTRSTALPKAGTTDATAHLGRELFFTGRGPQDRMSSESWGGCIVCHPNGRSDNITWMFDAGPRQTVSLDGMFAGTKTPSNQRLLNWSAVRDENQDFELNTRGVFGGRGLIDDDRLFYMIGGASGNTPSDSIFIEQFQQFTGQATITNDLAGGAQLPTLTALSPRRDFGLATLDDDRVYIIGGRNGAGQGSVVGATDAVVEFNPRTNVLQRRSSTGFTPRHSLGAAAVKTSGGVRVYAVGGYDSTSSTATPVNTVQEYNPATDTWRTVANLPAGAAQFGITVAGGVNTAEPRQLIHVVGGNFASEAAPTTTGPEFNIQRFQADPAGSGTWSAFNVTGITRRRNHGAATVFRGVQSRIFVIGGQDEAGNVVDTVEEYQAQSAVGVLSPHTSLPAPRARFGIGSSQSTNQIYVIAGVDGAGADQSTIFEYTVNANPTAGAAGPAGAPSGNWVTRGNLPAGRRSLGVSTPPGVTNLLPHRNRGRDARQDAIETFIVRGIRAAKAPVLASDPAATAGRQLFGQAGLVQSKFSCATCHGGAKWSRSRVDFATPPSPDDGPGMGNEEVIGAEVRRTRTQPNTQTLVTPPLYSGVLLNVGTFTLAGGRVNEVRFNGADISQAINPFGANGFNTPSLLSVHETAPYYYSGLAQTLEEVLNGSQDGNGGTRHHNVANATQRAQLIAFLRSIDEQTPIFP